MKKIILGLALVTGFAFATKAQTQFGVQAGVLMSNSKLEVEDITPENKPKVGFKVGAFAKISIADNFAFVPALNYVNYQSKSSASETEDFAGFGTVKTSSHEEYNMSYIELPLNISYSLPSVEGLSFGAGPVLSYGIGGKVKNNYVIDYPANFPTADVNESETYNVKFDGDENATDDDFHLKGFNFGANVFVGYELKSGLQFQLQYRPNFSNIALEDKTSFKNSYFGLTVGYTFGSNKAND